MSDQLNQLYVDDLRTRTVDCEFERAAFMARPSVMLGLRPVQDGKAFCVLLGENIQVGICGFGDTPDEAMKAFDKEWVTKARVAPQLQPAPQPRTPRPPLSLFEEVANLCDWVENTWMGSHKDKTISVRLALAAEKKRQELVNWLISVAKGHRYKATNLDIALRAIENYEKGEAQ